MSRSAVIASHYGDRNLGDVAIEQVVRCVLERQGYDPITLLVRREAISSSGERDISGLLGIIRVLFLAPAPSLLVIGGGGLIQNATSLGNLIVHFLAALWGRLRRQRVVLVGVGIGPLSGLLARLTALATVRLANGGCLVRDKQSAMMADKWSNLSVRCAPDLAFALSPLGLVGANHQAGSKHPPRMLLSLRPPVGNRSTRANPTEAYLLGLSAIRDVVFRIAVERRMEPVFLATHPEQDHELRSHLPSVFDAQPGWTYLTPTSPQELYGSISSGDVVVGMRLHSIIFAAMAGASFVALGYDPKVQNVVGAMGLSSQFVEMRDGTVDLDQLEAVLRRTIQAAPELEIMAKKTASIFGAHAAAELSEVLDQCVAT